MTHVLMTYPGLIPSVLLCGQFQLAFLAQTGKIEFRSISRNALTAEDCGWADIIFLVRSDSELEVGLARLWKRAGKKLIYVLDDDLCHVPMTSQSYKLYAHKTVQKSIQTLLTLSDYVLSPSEILREKYGGEKAIPVEEPSPAHPVKERRRGGPVRIGFAGSLDRGKDLDMLLGKVLETLLERYGTRISVEFFGVQPKIAQIHGLKCIPYCGSYEEYQQAMDKLDWDIGLAPMPETAFHACKHYNKFVEYAGCGIVGVYSDTIPYTYVVRDGQNGLLCANTAEAWINALSRLIDNESLRIRIARDAQQQADTEFSVEATALALEKALGSLLTYTALNHDPLEISSLLRMKICLRRVLFFFEHNGIRAPVVGVKKLRQKLIKRKESY